MSVIFLEKMLLKIVYSTVALVFGTYDCTSNGEEAQEEENDEFVEISMERV